ncbi:hypothetical protein BUALT_Bualt15G0099300 [Buddleja alternifolia]|uniref:F-box domain-containing protein n=1 Tax=Buddleja alternifolia TaxID=168488 RepID=A0AAV6WKQ6_9LAMI|nr:hypothetical protein BUALT_Bualt15G0099300 [Buddleja alternifolia]
MMKCTSLVASRTRVLQCYTRIHNLLRHIICGNNVVDFFAHVPDDVIVDILSRLPAYIVVQCREVCKKWRILTSSSHFIELHGRNAKPLTLMHFGYYTYPRTGIYPGQRLVIIDEKREKECKMRDLKELKYVRYVTSCNALVLLTSTLVTFKYYVLLNPLLSKGRVATIDGGTKRGHPCGFFFHPLAKEYRILFSYRGEGRYEYHLYLFGTKTWRRTMNPYFHCEPICYKVINRGGFNGGGLHWYINEIMVFDIISEELSMKPLPIEDGYRMPCGS